MLVAQVVGVDPERLEIAQVGRVELGVAKCKCDADARRSVKLKLVAETEDYLDFVTWCGMYRATNKVAFALRHLVLIFVKRESVAANVANL